MAHRNTLLAFVCLTLTGLWLIPAFGDTEFEAARLQAAAMNPPGVSVVLNLPAGRTQFHRGEIVPLSAVFASSLAGKYDLNTDPGSRDLEWNSDAFHVDTMTRAVDPLPVYYDHEFGMAYSGPGPQFQPLSVKALTVSYTLNEWLRFDAPGHYRVYLTSGRVTDAVKRHEGLFFSGHAATSNAVEFDVLPDDPAWSAQTLQAALPAYSKSIGENDYRTQELQAGAARTIRFLGTPDAARAMIARYRTFSEFNFLNTRAYFETRLGLFGFPQPGFVIAEMERCISDPDFPVSEHFIYDLAQAQFFAEYTQLIPRYAPRDPAKEKARQDLLQQRSGAEGALQEQDWERFKAAVPAKRGKARVASLYALSRPEVWDVNTPEHQNQVRVLVPVFETLTPDQQENLLSSHWSALREPALLPILRRLYAAPQPAGPGSIAEANALSLHSLALRRLTELSPAEGRALLLAEIKSAHPRVDLPTLCSLPDRRLPALNGLLAARLERHLRNQDEDKNASRLVERYATAAILPRVKAAYGNSGVRWDCDIQTNLIAYFLRTDPAYGAAQMRKVLAARKDTGCYRSVLSDVAALEAGPEVERLAVLHLHDPDAEVAADAAKMLGENGSLHDEPALWARLREWHRQWAGKSVDALAYQSELESALTFALSGSPHWLLNAGQLKTLGALCVSPAAKQNMEALARTWSDPVVIFYGGERDQWVLVQYDSLPSFAALESKLCQFPRGTRFRLSPVNFPDAAFQAQAFARLRPFLNQREMSLIMEPLPPSQPQ